MYYIKYVETGGERWQLFWHGEKVDDIKTQDLGVLKMLWHCLERQNLDDGDDGALEGSRDECDSVNHDEA